MLDVIIQTYNEELNLPHTLESVKGWVDNIFIVDSGSSDKTVEIGQKYGARVIYHAWEGYAAQKNWALDHLPLTSPWTMILDADEAVSPELRDEIKAIVAKPVDEVKESAFYLNRVFVFMGRRIHHCGYFPSYNLRLFKRGHARYEQRLVHEHMVVTGKTSDLKHLLIHEDRRGLEHFIAKHNRYSTLEAQEMYTAKTTWPGWGEYISDRNVRRRWLKNVVLPKIPMPWAVRFFYMYVFRLGFLDGVAGYRLSTFISSYELMIRMKYAELKQLGLDSAKQLQPVGGGLSVAEGKVPAGESDKKKVMDLGVAPQPSERPVTPTLLPVARNEKDVLGGVIEPSRGEVLALPHSLDDDGVKRAPVSVVIPTLNEGKNMARCLDHLRWADEVVVVDSGSKDDTVAIARKYGCVVIDFKWNGAWPKKKNWALRNVPFRNDWVLIVDADEWITPELADEIIRTVKAPGNNVGYYINRRFIFMGAWIKHCGYYPSWNLRLLKRSKGEYERLTDVGDTGSGDNEVHEHVKCEGDVAYLKEDMLHFAFPSISTFMEKHNRYSNWEAMVQFKGVEDKTSIKDNKMLAQRRWLKNFSRKLPFRPMLRFLYSYIWQGGFWDGKPGFVFCRLLAIYEYLSVAKHYELQRAAEDDRKAKAISSVPPTVFENKYE